LVKRAAAAQRTEYYQGLDL